MTKKTQQRVANLKSVLSEKNLTRVAYTHFKKITPIDTGNARRKTDISGNEIRAAYPYAQRLDTGWSNQAPQGMSKPTTQYLLDYIRKQITGK